MLGYQAHIAVQNSYLFQLHTGPKPPQNVEEIQTGMHTAQGFPGTQEARKRMRFDPGDADSVWGTAVRYLYAG